MKEKGFTLIELLAVIVILAIIALIAVPIVLNIIEDSKNSSNKRSIELYGKAIENAVGNYQLKNPQDKDITLEKINEYIEYKGNKVECEITEIYEDGTIYLDKCKIDNKSVEYTYGEKKTTQEYNGRYYWYDLAKGSIDDSLPSNATITPPEGREVYIGFDVEGDKISKAYVCLVRNETEYCLNDDNTGAIWEKLEDAYSDVKYTACSFYAGLFDCTDGSLIAEVYSNGIISARGENSSCTVNEGSLFECHK